MCFKCKSHYKYVSICIQIFQMYAYVKPICLRSIWKILAGNTNNFLTVRSIALSHILVEHRIGVVMKFLQSLATLRWSYGQGIVLMLPPRHWMCVVRPCIYRALSQSLFTSRLIPESMQRANAGVTDPGLRNGLGPQLSFLSFPFASTLLCPANSSAF